MQTTYIGLGSNLENPRQQLSDALQALAYLPDTRLEQCSSFYASDSLLPGQSRYLNAVARLATHLPPLALLDALQRIEQDHGRVRKEHWGPRTLDLDILLYGDGHIDAPRLQVPHPQMAFRSFVLYPLHELAPELVLPDGRSLASLLDSCPMLGLERVTPGNTVN